MKYSKMGTLEKCVYSLKTLILERVFLALGGDSVFNVLMFTRVHLYQQGGEVTLQVIVIDRLAVIIFSDPNITNRVWL